MSIIELFQLSCLGLKESKSNGKAMGMRVTIPHDRGRGHSLAHMAAHDQELMHKSSLGPGGVEGKPLRYLIPEMLMQQ